MQGGDVDGNITFLGFILLDHGWETISYQEGGII